MSAAGRVVGGDVLDGVVWTHRTRVHQAMDFRFAVRVTDPALGPLVEHIFGGFPTPPADRGPHIVYSVLEPAITGDGRHRVYADREQVISTTREAAVVNMLVWQVNQQVIAHAADRVLVHAAGAARDGVGVLLPAAMEAGKTTLVAALVRSGFDYLSDESVAVGRDGRSLVGYPKPLSIDPGSWDVLADLAPDVGDAQGYLGDQWQVPAEAVRPAATLTGEIRARFVVVPSYQPRGVTALEPMGGAEALRLLARQTFTTGVAEEVGLATLAGLVRHCGCYRLTVHDLELACEAIHGLVDGLAGRG